MLNYSIFLHDIQTVLVTLKIWKKNGYDKDYWHSAYDAKLKIKISNLDFENLICTNVGNKFLTYSLHQLHQRLS